MKDRALQALVKLSLEPEWEAKFEPNSYGFRPARSAHDAIQAIFLSVRTVPKYVLDADIEKCFDKINHEELLKRLNTYPSLTRLIRAWLKAGVMEDEVFSATEFERRKAEWFLLCWQILPCMEWKSLLLRNFPRKELAKKTFVNPNSSDMLMTYL